MAKTSVNVRRYSSDMEKKWDDFVLNRSFNGTFLQTRNFLNYHPEGRFVDCSVIIWRGTSDILAVIPASVLDCKGAILFDSHPGSTFGGIVFSEDFYDTINVTTAIEALEEWLIAEGFDGARLKQSSQIFCSRNCDLLDYCFFMEGWSDYREISFVIDYETYGIDIVSNFTSSRRRGYKRSQKAGLEFCQLHGEPEVREFYRVLSENLKKYGVEPVHTVEELLDLEMRLPGSVEFYGARHGKELVAAAMAFLFDNRVFHTQYLASDPDNLMLYPSNFLDTNMIALARGRGFKWFSFGISTEDRGKKLNESLAYFKEGFGGTYCNNRSYLKDFSKFCERE